ncbi:MAG: HDOD domain-containing protein [Desulfobacterales bacterium]|nr:HDOD domain-containing protein [Desulfobacterales bacterium]
MDIRERVVELIKKKNSDLPTLPAVVDRIIGAASDSKTTTEELSEIISFDQGITNKLLVLSNSVYYGQRTKVETIKRAITVIGFDEIIGIALAMSILSSFSEKSGLGLDMKVLWIHAIGCATAAKELAKRTNPSIADKIFVPALLHDMGKVILSIHFKDEYIEVRQKAIEEKKTLYVAENELLKINHASLAALLMKRWNFPDSILTPCRFHHNPEKCPVKLQHMALIVNLADYLTQKAGIGHSGNPVPVTVKNSFQKVGTNAQVLRMIIEKLKKKENQIKEFFRITTE